MSAECGFETAKEEFQRAKDRVRAAKKAYGASLLASFWLLPGDRIRAHNATVIKQVTKVVASSDYSAESTPWIEVFYRELDINGLPRWREDKVREPQKFDPSAAPSTERGYCNRIRWHKLTETNPNPVIGSEITWRTKNWDYLRKGIVTGVSKQSPLVFHVKRQQSPGYKYAVHETVHYRNILDATTTPARKDEQAR